MLATGRSAFSTRGYAGSRLADISGEASLTTGAFYRHFASKWDFFEVLYKGYGEQLLEALGSQRSLRAQIVAWLGVARDQRGVVRASQELARAGSPHLPAVRELRRDCAAAIAKRLNSSATAEERESRGASLMIVDVIGQYAVMEAAGWIPERDPRQVALQLDRLVKRGLYRR